MSSPSRRRVLAVYEHQEPDRVPCWRSAAVGFREKSKKELSLDDEGLRRRFRDDFRRVFAEYAGPESPVKYEHATSRTVFEIERTGYGYGQPLSHPVAEATIKQVYECPWPDPQWMDVSKIESQAQVYDGRYAILGGDWSLFLHDLIDLGHSYGLKVQMHCCGGFYDLIPMVSDSGLDGLHAVQPSYKGMYLNRLKSEFGDRMVFNGAIDSHHTLIDKDPDGVKSDTRKVLDAMMPGGGFIAGASHDTILEETSVANVLRMFDTIYECGVYS